MFKFRQWDPTLKTFLYFELVNGSVVISNPEINSLDKSRVNLPQELFIATDSGGKDIYTGDLVEGSWTWLDGKVDGVLLVNITDDKCVEPFYEKYGESSMFNRTSELYLNDFKVIGNIHENPELLIYVKTLA